MKIHVIASRLFGGVAIQVWAHAYEPRPELLHREGLPVQGTKSH